MAVTFQNKFLPRTNQDILREWKDSPNNRPLLISGSRQVGKSTLIEHFGEAYFKDVLHINFAMDPSIRECFAEANPKLVLAKLEQRRSKKIIPGTTLLVLDEIQDCGKAIETLGHFRDAVPKLHVLGCGTFINYTEQHDSFNIPVGRVQYLTMHPMTFKEFLLAVDEQELHQVITQCSWDRPVTNDEHQRLLQSVADYMMCGGMPAAVSTYVQTRSWETVTEIQQGLLQSIKNVFANHMQMIKTENSEQLFFKMLAMIIKQCDSFSEVLSEEESSQVKAFFNRVFCSGLFTRVNAVSSYDAQLRWLPINVSQKFRTLFLDCGLLFNAIKLSTMPVKANEIAMAFNGLLAQQFVGQELRAYSAGMRADLAYWLFDKQGVLDLDYVFDGVPVKISSSHSASMIFSHPELAHIKQGLQVCDNPLALRGKTVVMPFYLISETLRLVASVGGELRARVVA